MVQQVTQNFNFVLPDFAQVTWQDDYYDTMASIDALLAKTITFNQFKGVWENATRYVIGDVTVDDDLGILYTCVEDHASEAKPITFLEDRADFPDRWVQSTITESSRGTWLAGATYTSGNFVVNGGKYAVCLVTHTASANFNADVALGYWDVLIDVSTISGTGDMHSAANLSDLANVTVARTNLGLGTAATHAATEFATSAQGTKADSAIQSADLSTALSSYVTSASLAVTLSSYITAAGVAAAYQPLDADLTALAGLTSAANAFPVFTGSGTAGLVTVTASSLVGMGASGNAAKITLGTNLSMSGTTLNAAGSVLVWKFQRFTASGTFTTSANITTSTIFKVTVTGGGAGGGYIAAGTHGTGDGGAAAGTAIHYVSGLSPSTGYTITIGAAGAGGFSGTAPTNGGSSQTVLAGVTTVGNAPGSGASNRAAQTTPNTGFISSGGYAGGTFTVGFIGGYGHAGIGLASGVGLSGEGGASYWGQGGYPSQNSNTSGNNGVVGSCVPYGAGGSGVTSLGASSTGTAGAGNAGVALIEWWE